MFRFSTMVGQIGRPFEDLNQAVWWEKVGISLTVPQKGNREEINALGKLVARLFLLRPNAPPDLSRREIQNAFF